MGKVIAVVTEKGGVGKTTTSQTLAYCLAKKGKKVALIDFDGQAHSTLMCGFPKPEQIKTTILTLINRTINEEELPALEEFIIHCKNGIDLIPSNSQLFVLERNLTLVDYREYILKKCIAAFKNQYDYIIIDCMPQLGTAMLNAMVCADSLIIPTQAEILSAQGLTQLLKHYYTVKEKSNRQLAIEGILITMDSERTTLSAQIKEILKTNYGEHMPIFKTCIPRSIQVGRAPGHFMNICEFEPKNPAAKAYEKLTEEVLANGS